MVPIPQYPLYTATLSVLNARCVPYYLDESRAWSTDMDAIRTAYQQARAQGTDVRAIVVINPGNPTGASLSEDDMRQVLQFAAEEKLVVMADEVYQTNVFQGEFHSFKKALRDLQKAVPDKYDNLELASLHSISKGMVGECGHRGGYFELVGFDSQVAAQILKFVSIMLCAPVVGQCLVEMMVHPPQEGDPSYALYRQEYDGIFEGLKQRATALYEAFKQMEGVECQDPQVRRHVGSSTPAHKPRAPCTSSLPSIYQPPPSSRQRRKSGSPMRCTACGSWTRPACASYREEASVRGLARSTSGQPSWPLVRSGWAGSPGSTRNSWKSSGIGRIVGVHRQTRRGKSMSAESLTLSTMIHHHDSSMERKAV